jgi:Ser-tRNA(Ala) deacylase AlaX
VQPGVAALEVGMQVTGKIDWKRRYRIMRHHSAQHSVYLAFQRSTRGRLVYRQRWRGDARQG